MPIIRRIQTALSQQTTRFTLLFIWGAATALGLYLDSQPYLVKAEQVALAERFSAYSLYFGDVRPWAKKQIVLVPMSDETFNPQGGGIAGPPASRLNHARMVRDLTRAGARAIVFDLLFDAAKPQDPQFARAVRESGKVAWGALYESYDNQTPPRLIGPSATLKSANARVGHINQNLTQGRVDTMCSFEKLPDGSLLPSLSLQGAAIATGMRDFSALPSDINDEFRITFWKDGQSVDNHGFFPSVPYEDVLQGVADDPFYRPFFKNKIVIIGDVTTVGNDFRNTPIAEQMSGMEIQAHAIATVLAAIEKGMRPVSHVPFWLNAFFIALGAGAACWIVARLRWSRIAPALVASLLVFGTLNVAFFVMNALDVHLVTPILTLVLAALMTFANRALTEEREKDRVKSYWQRHVDPQVAEWILRHPDQLAMGEEREATVLFADIRGFTRLFDVLTPNETLALLNAYLQTMTEVVKRNGGTLDKYVGDAVMGVFGLPMPCDDHALRAVRAALEMQDEFALLRERWQDENWRARGLPDFDIGIGVNTGLMLCGELGVTTGDQQRADFTVIGDAVNVAAHIENQTKQFKTRLLIGETTFERCQNQVRACGPLTATIKYGRKILIYDDIQLSAQARERDSVEKLLARVDSARESRRKKPMIPHAMIPLVNWISTFRIGIEAHLAQAHRANAATAPQSADSARACKLIAEEHVSLDRVE